MSEAADARPALERLSARFPEDAVRLRRRFLRDASFRMICEDYALALASLDRLRATPDGHNRPEVAEYRGVIRELEAEIREQLLEDRGEP